MEWIQLHCSLVLLGLEVYPTVNIELDLLWQLHGRLSNFMEYIFIALSCTLVLVLLFWIVVAQAAVVLVTTTSNQESNYHLSFLKVTGVGNGIASSPVTVVWQLETFLGQC